MKWIPIIFIFLFGQFVLNLYIMDKKQDQHITEIQKFQFQIDSLKKRDSMLMRDLQLKQIEINRHKVAFEYLQEHYPTAAHYYDGFIFHEED